MLQTEITRRIEGHLTGFLSTPRKLIQMNAVGLQKGYLNPYDSQLLERYFWHQINAFPSVSSIYFGNPSGGLANSGREKDTGQQ